MIARKDKLDNREVIWPDELPDGDRFTLVGDVDVFTFEPAKDEFQGSSSMIDISKELQQEWYYANIYSTSMG